jgi:uncharacterized protein (PEP-CTERM system associated)
VRDQKNRGIAARWRWEAGARTDLRLGATLNKTEFESGNDKDVLRLTAGFDYELGQSTVATLGYEYRDEDTSKDTADFTSNIATLRLTHSF